MNWLDKFKKTPKTAPPAKAVAPERPAAAAAVSPDRKAILTDNAILVRPLISEKSALLQEQGQYLFEVARRATKPAIRRAVEELFEVKVKSVNIINRPGKTKRLRGHLGRQSGFKKAMVKLKAGDKIEVVPH